MVKLSENIRKIFELKDKHSAYWEKRCELAEAYIQTTRMERIYGT